MNSNNPQHSLASIPKSGAQDMAGRLPQVPRSPSNHFANFFKAAKGHEKCRSSFAVAGPLSQMMCLGVIAQWRGSVVQFDRVSRQITDDMVANALLIGPPPRKGWDEFYRL